MKRIVLFLGLLLGIVPVFAAGNLVDVKVRDRASGRVLPVYGSGGRWFVAGTPGNEFSIELRNCGPRDLLAVVSVDGVNVVSGETAAPSQSGYVIGARGALSILGWRKSFEKVAAFYFTDLGDSYAARTGRPDNVGVIGVALFRRKVVEPLAQLERPKERAAASHAANDSAPRSAPPAVTEKKIGTGQGSSQSSPARYVEFERDSDQPAEVVAIHYDTYANLVARGVIREERRYPAPFPGGFVPDPPQRG